MLVETDIMEHMRIITKENNVDDYRSDIEESGCRYSAGPLYINRSGKKASTVMGAELILDDKEFDVLDILASREGEYVTFDELYKEIWGLSEKQDSKAIAATTIDDLIKKVSLDGYGFMWIDYTTEEGYMFKTHWGNNWNPQGRLSSNEQESGSYEVNATPIKIIVRRRSRSVEYIAGIGAIAAAIILMLLLLFNSPILKTTDVDPLFLEVEDTNIPLAQLDFEDTG